MDIRQQNLACADVWLMWQSARSVPLRCLERPNFARKVSCEKITRNTEYPHNKKMPNDEDVLYISVVMNPSVIRNETTRNSVQHQHQEGSIFTTDDDNDITTSYNLLLSTVCSSSSNELLNDHLEENYSKDDKNDIPIFHLAHAIALTKWLLLLLLAWLLTKIICFCGLPSNCDAGLETVAAMEDLHMLFVFV